MQVRDELFFAMANGPVDALACEMQMYLSARSLRAAGHVTKTSIYSVYTCSLACLQRQLLCSMRCALASSTYVHSSPLFAVAN